jgi:hypothetical protein
MNTLIHETRIFQLKKVYFNNQARHFFASGTSDTVSYIFIMASRITKYIYYAQLPYNHLHRGFIFYIKLIQVIK